MIPETILRSAGQNHFLRMPYLDNDLRYSGNLPMQPGPPAMPIRQGVDPLDENNLQVLREGPPSPRVEYGSNAFSERSMHLLIMVILKLNELP